MCILEYVRVCAMQDAGAAGFQRGGVVAEGEAAPARLDTDQFHRGVVDKRRERADRVRAAAHARHHPIWQAADDLEGLRARFATDHRLKCPTDFWIGVR